MREIMITTVLTGVKLFAAINKNCKSLQQYFRVNTLNRYRQVYVIDPHPSTKYKAGLNGLKEQGEDT